MMSVLAAGVPTAVAAVAAQAGTETVTVGNGSAPQESLRNAPWVPEIVPGWAVETIAAVFVLVIAWGVSKLLIQLFGRRIAQRFRRPSLTRMILSAIRAGVFIFAFLTILRIYGYTLGNIALSVTVFSAVVGVVLAPIVGSIISGVFLLADQPYEIGDMIEIADTERRGFVEDITLRYTKIFTLENSFLVLPNGEIRSRDIINYSAEDPRVRLDLDVVVTYEGDLAEARRLIERAAREVDAVIEGGPDIRIGSARYPAAPTCFIDTFGDHGVHLRLRYWLKEPYKLLATRSAVQTNVWEKLADADVEIAYPHRHHVFDDTSGELAVGVASGEQSARRSTRGPVDPDNVDGPASGGVDADEDGG
jgi:small-conductance mechanosensitive channel